MLTTVYYYHVSGVNPLCQNLLALSRVYYFKQSICSQLNTPNISARDKMLERRLVHIKNIIRWDVIIVVGWEPADTAKQNVEVVADYNKQ